MSLKKSDVTRMAIRKFIDEYMGNEAEDKALHQGQTSFGCCGEWEERPRSAPQGTSDKKNKK